MVEETALGPGAAPGALACPRWACPWKAQWRPASSGRGRQTDSRPWALVLTLPHLAVCLWADHCPLRAWVT